MSSLHTYSADGLARVVLEAVEGGPCSFSGFCQAISTQNRRRKAWYVVQAMRADGLIERIGPESYDITTEGLEALCDLRAGRDVVMGEAVPTVRIFAERAVAALGEQSK